MVDYRYSWRDGALVKIDRDGNLIGAVHTQPVSRAETSEPAHPIPSVNQNQLRSDTMEDVSQQLPNVAYEELPIIDENTHSEPKSPEKVILTSGDLAKRDREAVEYSKALLVEGDTLVYISYPGDSKCFDSTGFEISGAPHRVHSSRLLATGSKVFAKLLSPTNQYRIIRRKKLVGNLPTGIKYVLDLTPPDEGDEAVQLTSELSCSLGIRLWYTAADRCGVSYNLVGGEDEVMDPRNVTSYGAPTFSASREDSEFDGGPPPKIPDQPTDDTLPPPPVTWESLETIRQNREIADAVRMSLEELSRSRAKKSMKIDPSSVPEYCPIRHRAGIGRLLRVLEGKDPRLDSAPKVWTLFVLAKYFDCTAAVVDWIVSWVIADPNTQFVEILPEASCKMAFGLNNQMICRAAFSVLVSEEALSLASRETGRIDADRNGTNQFGRLREDIDEDIRTRIEYASKTFSSRVCKAFESLAEEEMSWVTQLPEYQKLQSFKIVVLRYVDNNKQALKWSSAIDQLSFGLRKYIRSRIISSLSCRLTPDLANSANNHRRAERYTIVSTCKKLDGTFSLLYDKLLDKERLFTRFFWLHILYTDFPSWFNGARPSDSDSNIKEAYLAGVRPSVSTLLISQDHLNESILEAIKDGVFNDGIMPLEALRDYNLSYTSKTYDDQENSKIHKPLSNVDNVSVPNTKKSWSPFSVFKSVAMPQEASISDEDAQNTSMASDWKTASINSHRGFQWDLCMSSDKAEDTEPLIPREPSGVNPKHRNVSRGTQSADMENMDVDEYLAQHHLLNPQSGLEKASNAERGFSVANSDLPLRPKVQSTISPAQKSATGLDERRQQAIPNTVEPFESRTANTFWTPEEPSLTGQANDKHYPRWKAESYSSRFLRESQSERPIATASSISHAFMKNSPKPTVPGDDEITTRSPFFNMSKLFLQAKDHIRDVATAMLDQREMGFDVGLTDTLLCLGPEEFKYLPLWAGGDDDGSGGVFDDTIPFPLAGPNGPGPSFHTGYSNASAASSEFDTMSDTTAFNTSVAVEDGFSDHIDRRLVVADDDFHSETFSEDSELYDRKGKAVDRSGFYTSAPTSEAAFSLADTRPDSIPDIDTPDSDSNFEIDDEDDEDENSDADTTVGQVDGEEDDAWDGGDTESFDFGDSDEEMANV